MHLNPRLAAVYNRSPFDEKRFLIDADPSGDLRRAPLPSGETPASLAQYAGPSWAAALLLLPSLLTALLHQCSAPESGLLHPLPSVPLCFWLTGPILGL